MVELQKQWGYLSGTDINAYDNIDNKKINDAIYINQKTLFFDKGNVKHLIYLIKTDKPNKFHIKVIDTSFPKDDSHDFDLYLIPELKKQLEEINKMYKKYLKYKNKYIEYKKIHSSSFTGGTSEFFSEESFGKSPTGESLNYQTTIILILKHLINENNTDIDDNINNIFINSESYFNGNIDGYSIFIDNLCNILDNSYRLNYKSVLDVKDKLVYVYYNGKNKSQELNDRIYFDSDFYTTEPYICYKNEINNIISKLENELDVSNNSRSYKIFEYIISIIVEKYKNIYDENDILFGNIIIENSPFIFKQNAQYYINKINDVINNKIITLIPNTKPSTSFINNINILSYNVCWEALYGIKSKKLNMKHCNKEYINGINICMNNIINIIMVGLTKLDIIEYDFINLQESSDLLIKKILEKNNNYFVQQVTYNLETMSSLYSKKYSIPKIYSGDLDEGRPYLILLFKKEQIININVHMPHSYTKQINAINILKRALDEINKEYPLNNYRIFISGDFNNTNPFLNLNITSIINKFGKRFYNEPKYNLTCCDGINGSFNNGYDHIYDTNNSSVYYELLTKADYDLYIDNKKDILYMSDHLPIYASFDNINNYSVKMIDRLYIQEYKTNINNALIKLKMFLVNTDKKFITNHKFYNIKNYIKDYVTNMQNMLNVFDTILNTNTNDQNDLLNFYYDYNLYYTYNKYYLSYINYDDILYVEKSRLYSNKYPSLICIRHAEGEHQIIPDYNMINPRLTPNGIAQAINTGFYFNYINGNNYINTVICSPLIRCIETLILLNIHGLKDLTIFLADDLIEVSNNHKCNKRQSKSELIEYLNSNYGEYKFDLDNVSNDYNFNINDNIDKRINNFIDKISEIEKSNVLIVTHRNWIDTFYNIVCIEKEYLINKNYNIIPQNYNCAINYVN